MVIFCGSSQNFLGGESLFVNHFTNNTSSTRRVTLVQSTPEIHGQWNQMGNNSASSPVYIASTPGVQLESSGRASSHGLPAKDCLN